MVGSLILPGWLDRNGLRFGEYGLIVDTKRENMSFSLSKYRFFIRFFFLESLFILECVYGILGRFFESLVLCTYWRVLEDLCTAFHYYFPIHEKDSN